MGIRVFANIRRLIKIKRNSCWQQQFLYPLLFQDDLYGIAYNRSLHESNHRRKKKLGLSDGFDSLTLKRLIKYSRQSSFSWMFHGRFNQIRIVREILIMILNLSISSRYSVKKMNGWSSYQSIHSIFPFMEDGIHNSANCLNVVLPHRVHPELFIRIFRRYTSDISFLHFLRLLLHRDKDVIVLNPALNSYLKENKFDRFVWNFYIREFEYSLIYIWKQIYPFKVDSVRFPLSRTNFFHKIKNVSENFDFEITKNIFERKYCINYLRYRNNLIITINADIKLVIGNWVNFIICFWGRYFRSWFAPYGISIKQLSKNPFFFLGYIVSTKSESMIIRIKLMSDSIDTNLINKEFCSIIPIVPLIGSLAREGFCDTSGRPICRLSWTTLADNEIIEQFDKIATNISCYYSGCLNKKGLYQLQYIFRFSCAKTLACKHKSNIRTVWKKYGSNSVTNSVSFRKTKLVSANYWRVNLYARKIWYLGITRTNHLAKLLPQLRDV